MCHFTTAQEESSHRCMIGAFLMLREWSAATVVKRNAATAVQEECGQCHARGECCLPVGMADNH